MPETLVQITLPEMGESVSEGSIVEWRKKIGEYVAEGDPLVEVTTDKVDVEVPSTASGVVKQILAQEGTTVGVGAVLAEIDTSATPAQATPAAAASNGAPAAAPQKGPPMPAAAEPAQQRNAATAGDLVTPQARRLARKLQIDLGRVKGSGPQGLVLRDDVASQSALAGSAVKTESAPLPPLNAQAKVVELKGPAAALTAYMEQSLTIPTATSFRTLSVDVLDARRRDLNAALKKASRPEKISFTHVIAYALVRAAREMPFITHSFRREGGKPARVEPGIHLGLAVDAQRKDGSRFLVVPVIKNAATLDFAQFRGAYEDLVAKARENRLAADELQGASFTLTNPGGIGTSASVPRLMAGQGAIIATGAIGYPPGFSAAGESALQSLGVGKIMQITSTYDHRVIQGAQSGEYLRRVDELLQGSDGFYDDVFSSLELIPAASAASAAVRTDGAPAAVSADMLRAVAAGMAVVAAYRTHGHLAANLDPLGTPPIGDPSLEPANWGLTPALQSAIPASVLRVKVRGDTLSDVLPRLRETYSSTIAYEVEHISNTEQREWLRDVIESGKHKVPISDVRQIELLRRLTRVDAFERYLRKTFLGQKTFSGEGLDVMVPMLEEMLELLASEGTSTAVIGMAHRGRLATIAHVVNLPYEEILAEFEAAHERGEVHGDVDVTGDVKYHHGANGTYQCEDGRSIAVVLANNPSHLEAVDPVVEGTARALQTDHSHPQPTQDIKKAAPILIHGDAAFVAQGIVAEVFNLQSLAGYETGGTIHIIANNQVGFTTDPRDARSTRYASDLAKGFDVPIVHVNADDVDACIWAVHLAHEFRKRFHRDVVLEIIGYRRFGHNEQDEPAYTQPAMYERIKAHPGARDLFANKLIAQGVLSKEQADELVSEATTRLQQAHRAVKGQRDIAGMLAKLAHAAPATAAAPPKADADRLLAWSDALVEAPQNFSVNKKLRAQFERRKNIIHERGVTDWGMAESLAFASLISAGVPIRLTGQDTERGTFSHRHDVLHDTQTGAAYTPLQHLPGAKASFEIHNSPLSEYSCLGFEYGYSTTVPNALVLWEAQFGDFNNGGQIIIDQFIVAGQAKWGQTARLTLLLPHGYEGMGPEHSSARLERFLQLAAEGNLRVANLSSATNYYHLLRQQATMPQPVPLVVMTPKSLLRQESAGGRIDEMANGKFQAVIDDPAPRERATVERILLCTGKMYHDLIAHERYSQLKKSAIVRIELLSPLPYTEINDVIATYPNAKKLVWVQEEPKNMGARAYVRRRLIERRRDQLEIDYVGRPYRASPSEGYPGAHAAEQERLLNEALTE